MNILKKAAQLKNHTGFMKYFSNTSWLMAERILRMTVALFGWCLCSTLFGAGAISVC